MLPPPIEAFTRIIIKKNPLVLSFHNSKTYQIPILDGQMLLQHRLILSWRNHHSTETLQLHKNSTLREDTMDNEALQQVLNQFVPIIQKLNAANKRLEILRRRRDPASKTTGPMKLAKSFTKAAMKSLYISIGVRPPNKGS